MQIDTLIIVFPLGLIYFTAMFIYGDKKEFFDTKIGREYEFGWTFFLGWASALLISIIGIFVVYMAKKNPIYISSTLPRNPGLSLGTRFVFSFSRVHIQSLESD